jgi:hypothetical protein
MTPLFVFCADLHLEDGAWTTRPGIYGDAYYSFQQIIDYCIEHRLPLILGGDVLEKKQNLARPVAKLCEGLSRMQDEDLDVYYIQGNHEYDRNAPWLSIHPWPKHLHNRHFYFKGVKVWGLDWLPRGEIQAAFKEVPPDTKILITHQVWKDLMGDVGRTECSLLDVHYVQTVLAGDYHVTTVVESVNAQDQPITLLSPGSTAMQDISEEPRKSFFVICDNSDGSYAFSPRRLLTRQFLGYKVQTQTALDDLCAGRLAADIAAATDEVRARGAPPEIRKPLVRVKFNKDLPDAYVRLVAAVGETAHLFCDVLAERVDEVQKPTNRDATKNDLLQVLADVLGEDTDAYKFAQELLQAPNPKRAVEEHFYSYVKEAANATSTAGSSELGASPEEDV